MVQQPRDTDGGGTAAGPAHTPLSPTKGSWSVKGRLLNHKWEKNEEQSWKPPISLGLRFPIRRMSTQDRAALSS